MTAYLKVGEQIITPDDLFPLLAKYQMLTKLARELVIDQAIADIASTPEEENAARQRFCQQNQIVSEEQLQAWLTQQGMTSEQLTALLVRDIKLEKFKQVTWEHQIDSYFLKCKTQLDRVVYSLIRSQDPGIAQELYFRIQEGEASFADLAQSYSQGSEAQTGGLVGPVELNVPHPKIAKMLSASQPGQLWPPTQVGEWWVILRLEKYLGAQLDPPMRKRLLDDLFQTWLRTQMQQTVSLPTINQATEVETV